MPDLSNWLAYALISLGMVLTPGPNMIYLISRSICQGRTAGYVSLGGVALGLSWLERTPDKGEVGSSNLPRPTNFVWETPVEIRGHSSAGRAPALHAGGQRFDPVWLHHYCF